MPRILSCLFAALGVASAAAFSLSMQNQNVILGQTATFLWTRDSQDPDHFSLYFRDDTTGGTLGPVKVDSQEQLSGSVILNVPSSIPTGSYQAYAFAGSSGSTSDLIATTGFSISDSQSNTSTTGANTESATSGPPVTSSSVNSAGSSSLSRTTSQASATLFEGGSGSPWSGTIEYNTASFTTTSSALSSGSTSLQTTDSSESSSSQTTGLSSLSTTVHPSHAAVIAGSLIGALVAAALLAGLILFLHRRSKRNGEVEFNKEMMVGQRDNATPYSFLVLDDVEQQRQPVPKRDDTLPSYGFSNGISFNLEEKPKGQDQNSRWQ